MIIRLRSTGLCSISSLRTPSPPLDGGYAVHGSSPASLLTLRPDGIEVDPLLRPARVLHVHRGRDAPLPLVGPLLRYIDPLPSHIDHRHIYLFPLARPLLRRLTCEQCNRCSMTWSSRYGVMRSRSELRWTSRCVARSATCSWCGMSVSTIYVSSYTWSLTFLVAFAGRFHGGRGIVSPFLRFAPGPDLLLRRDPPLLAPRNHPFRGDPPPLAPPDHPFRGDPPPRGATRPTPTVTTSPVVELDGTDLDHLPPIVDLHTPTRSSQAEADSPPLDRGHRVPRPSCMVFETPYASLPPMTPIHIQPDVVRAISPVTIAMVAPDPARVVLDLYRSRMFRSLRITYLEDCDCMSSWWGELLGFERDGYLDDEHIVGWLCHLSESRPDDTRWAFVHSRFSGEVANHSEDMLRFCTQYTDVTFGVSSFWEVDRLLVPWYLPIQHWVAVVIDLRSWTITRYDSLHTFTRDRFDPIMDIFETVFPQILRMIHYWEHRGETPPESIRFTRVAAHTVRHNRSRLVPQTTAVL